MKSFHLMQELAVAKRVAERAAEFDDARARVELGGYLEVLIQHPVGRVLVRHWATDFRRGLDAMDAARDRVITRLRKVRDIILSTYDSCPEANPELDKIKAGLKSLESAIEVEWFGPEENTTIDLSILFEPLKWYSDNVEWALFHAQEHGIELDFKSLHRFFREAIQAGEAGDTEEVLDALKSDRLRALDELEQFRSRPTMSSAITELESFQVSDVSAGIQYILQLRPSVLAASKRAGIELLFPQIDLFLILGGHQALVLRRSSLGSGPRHPWWSLVRLVFMARHSRVGLEAVSNGDLILARIGRAIATGLSVNPNLRRMQELAGLPTEDKAPTNARLLLELEKVHLSVSSHIERGAAIDADLLRYRQRAQWYCPSDLAAAITSTEQVDSGKLSEREKAAVQHLAVWLFDQGYVPLSRTLGRGRTDLEDQTPGEGFLIEAKILTQSTFPRTQAAMDALCRTWVNQALEYADVQGLDRAYVVVFNASESSQLTAAAPTVVADRLTIQFYPISVTEKPPSKMKGAQLILRWQQDRPASTDQGAEP